MPMITSRQVRTARALLVRSPAVLAVHRCGRAIPLHLGRPRTCYPRSRRRAGCGRAVATADKLVEAVSLDKTGYWRPTVRTYLGRITKARILEAVREAVNDEAADQMANMKKQAMAEAAEQVLA